MSEAITDHRYVNGEDGCSECGEPIWRHWYTHRRNSPEEMEMTEAMLGEDWDE